jgi:hypothetical protein
VWKDIKVFENFDWNSFWEESDYALKASVGKIPTDEEIEEFIKGLIED